MSEKKNNDKDTTIVEIGGTYVTVGVLLGIGIGMLTNEVLPFMFMGLGVGYALKSVAKRNYEKKAELSSKTGTLEKNEYTKTSEISKIDTPTYLESTINNYKEVLSKIEILEQRLPKDKRVIVTDLITLLNKIYEYVSEDFSHYSQVKVFFQTYIHSLENILQTYVLLIDQPVMNVEANSSLLNIEQMLGEMKIEFEEAYVLLYKKEITRVNLEIEILRNKFKEEKAPKLF